MTDPYDLAPHREPAEALRHVARVTKEEAAALADEEPLISSWLDRISSGIFLEARRLFPD